MHFKRGIMRLYIAAAVLLLVTGEVFSQGSRVDSLTARLRHFEAEKAAAGAAFNPQRDTVKADILSSLAIAYSHINPDKCLGIANEQLAVSERAGYKYGIANACEMQAFVYEHRGNYKKALRLLERARAVYLSAGRMADAINTDNGIGVQYAKQGIYTEALKYLFRALADAKKNKDYWSIMSTCNNIGLVYTKNKDLDRALTYYFESLNVQLRHNEKRAIAYTYMNLGEIYGRKEMYSESRKYFEQGIKYALENEDNIALANNYCGLGILYIKQASYGPAATMLHKARGIMETMADAAGLCTVYLSLGEIESKTGNSSQALHYTQKAHEMAAQGGSRETYRQVYRQFSDVYAGMGNFKEAYNNHLLYKQYNDSVFNDENSRKLTEQRMDFEFKAIQQKKDIAAKEALQHQKNIRNITVAGLVAAAIATIALLVRRHKKSNAKKQQAYAHLQQQLARKHLEAQALRVENENIELRNSLMEKEKEKLQEKLDFNRRELASATLYLYQKNELLSGLKDDIETLSQGDAPPGQIGRIKSTIQQNLYMDADWDKFKLHFEQVHPDFFKSLNHKHPGLTAYEVRLCAYLHLNLSTKEIAALLNITPGSVTKAKVRLNKKLNRTENEMAGQGA
jgi:tetratricopeptide (TPR) repeat protein